MPKTVITLFTLFIAGCLLMPVPTSAQSDDGPVVQAVLFYSPTCPHCHMVIQELLVPMVEEYGDQLQIIGIDTSQPEGSQLYQTAIEHYEIPSERRGVPTLIVSDVVLVGSGEIPEKFPGIVEGGLAAEGIAWPEIPGFQPDLAAETESEGPAEEEAADPSPTPAATEEASTSEAPQTEPEQALPTVPATEPTESELEVIPTVEPEIAAGPASPQEPGPSGIAISEESIPATETQAPPSDPVGMALAAGVMILMGAALILTLGRLTMDRSWQLLSGHPIPVYATTWLIPALSVVGLGVSIYLAYVEVSQVEAVCGPVGHCNIVQASPYARILGVPIAILGILNYLAIIILWAGQRVEPLATLSVLGLLALTIFSTLFSIYLTLLEIFVIQAVCMWCLSSAVITTLLMLLVVMPITGRSRLQSALSH